MKRNQAATLLPSFSWYAFLRWLQERQTNPAKVQRTEILSRMSVKKKFLRILVYPKFELKICLHWSNQEQQQVAMPQMTQLTAQWKFVEQLLGTRCDHTKNIKIPSIKLYRLTSKKCFTLERLNRWYKMSCIACTLKLSSTLVYGVRKI